MPSHDRVLQTFSKSLPFPDLILFPWEVRGVHEQLSLVHRDSRECLPDTVLFWLVPPGSMGSPCPQASFRSSLQQTAIWGDSFALGVLGKLPMHMGSSSLLDYGRRRCSEFPTIHLCPSLPHYSWSRELSPNPLGSDGDGQPTWPQVLQMSRHPGMPLPPLWSAPWAHEDQHKT